jgi:hypothetical protein
MDSHYFVIQIDRVCPAMLLCNVSVQLVDDWNLVYAVGGLGERTWIIWLWMFNSLSRWFNHA